MGRPRKGYDHTIKFGSTRQRQAELDALATTLGVTVPDLLNETIDRLIAGNRTRPELKSAQPTSRSRKPQRHPQDQEVLFKAS